MYKYFVVLGAVIVSLFFSAPIVQGIDLGNNLMDRTASSAGYAPATETSFSEILGSVVRAALSFVGVIFLVLTVYAGYLWMTARGDSDQVDKAGTIIRSAVIGLIITTAAYSIVAWVLPTILSRTAGQPVSGEPTADPNQLGRCSYTTGSLTGETSGSQTNVTEQACSDQCRSLSIPSGRCRWAPNR